VRRISRKVVMEWNSLNRLAGGAMDTRDGHAGAAAAAA